MAITIPLKAIPFKVKRYFSNIACSEVTASTSSGRSACFPPAECYPILFVDKVSVAVGDIVVPRS